MENEIVFVGHDHGCHEDVHNLDIFSVLLLIDDSLGCIDFANLVEVFL